MAGCILFRLTVAAPPLERSLPLGRRFWWLLQSQYAQAQAAVQQQQVRLRACSLVQHPQVGSTGRQDGCHECVALLAALK